MAILWITSVMYGRPPPCKGFCDGVRSLAVMYPASDCGPVTAAWMEIARIDLPLEVTSSQPVTDDGFDRSADSIEARGHRRASEAGYMTASDLTPSLKLLPGRGPSIHDGRSPKGRALLAFYDFPRRALETPQSSSNPIESTFLIAAPHKSREGLPVDSGSRCQARQRGAEKLAQAQTTSCPSSFEVSRFTDGIEVAANPASCATPNRRRLNPQAITNIRR